MARIPHVLTYTELRDFLDRYTNDDGRIMGDPSAIAAEAVAAGLVRDDEQRVRQHPYEYEERAARGQHQQGARRSSRLGFNRSRRR